MASDGRTHYSALDPTTQFAVKQTICEFAAEPRSAREICEELRRAHPSVAVHVKWARWFCDNLIFAGILRVVLGFPRRYVAAHMERAPESSADYADRPPADGKVWNPRTGRRVKKPGP